MNNLQTFNFQNLPVRTVQLNNQPYFNLKDVCEVLDIKNHKDVVSRLNPKGGRYYRHPYKWWNAKNDLHQ